MNPSGYWSVYIMKTDKPDHIAQKFQLGDKVKGKITQWVDGIQLTGHVEGIVIAIRGKTNWDGVIDTINVEIYDGQRGRTFNQNDCEKIA